MVIDDFDTIDTGVQLITTGKGKRMFAEGTSHPLLFWIDGDIKILFALYTNIFTHKSLGRYFFVIVFILKISLNTINHRYLFTV